MLEMYVRDINFTLLGEISEYESLEREENYGSISKLVLRINYTSHNYELLKIGNVIIFKDNPLYGYIIDHSSVVYENSEIIEVFAYSLNFLLTFRSIQRQQRFYGEASRVIENFVTYNCINVEPNRVIPDLSIGVNLDLVEYADSTQTGGDVLTHIFSLAQEREATVDILLSEQFDGFRFKIFRGLDRSISQNIIAPVVFSKELENVINTNYFESYLNYKNVAVVAGEGEGINRTIVLVNNGEIGLQRRELYVDARDLSRTYYDENNNEITLTEQEYEETLRQRGLEALKEFSPIKTFEAQVDDTQFKLNVDYFLGDKVTFIDDELSLAMDVRVTSIKTTSSRKGTIIQPSFGTGLPRKINITEVYNGN